MEKRKKIVNIDMDDCCANFFASANDPKYPGWVDERKMYDKDFFYNLKPIPGALRNIRGIIQLGFDVWILTQPLANWAPSYEEKVRWINQYLPELTNKITMTQNKGMVVGEYLVDDNETKWKEKFEKNGGKFILFDYNRANPDPKDLEEKWEKIYQFFCNEDSTCNEQE